MAVGASREFVLRELVAADVAGVLDVQAESHAGRYLESAESFADKISSAPGYCVGVFRDERLLAYGIALPFAEEGHDVPLDAVCIPGIADQSRARVLYIHDVAVRRAESGAGLGSAIVHELWCRATLAGIPTVELVAVGGSSGFWAGWGCMPVADHSAADLGYGDEAVRMSARVLDNSRCIDHEYSPSRHALRPLADYLREYRRLSAPYSDLPELRSPGSPLLIYVHGGYWQQLSAADSLFNAADALALGVDLHAVEYTLAPEASIPEIIEECIVDVVRVIDELSPSRTVLAGCSAGAHLVAMCLRDPRVSAKVDAAVLLSGIYDLRPLVVTPTNDALGLTDETASALSPRLLTVPRDLPPVLCAVGGHESREFIRQTREYAALVASSGADVTVLVEEERDHFDLPFDLLRAGTRVGDWVIETLTGAKA